MQKVLVILGLVLFLAVVEQTSGQICSENFCRFQPRSDCGCKGCCVGKLGYKYGRCEHRGIPGSRWGCFCYRFDPDRAQAIPPDNSGTTKPPV